MVRLLAARGKLLGGMTFVGLGAVVAAIAAAFTESRALLLTVLAIAAVAVVAGWAVARALSGEVGLLAAEARKVRDSLRGGRLTARVDPGPFGEALRPGVAAMNEALDALAAPLGLATSRATQLARGDTPAPAAEQLPGDLASLGDALDRLAREAVARTDHLQTLVAAAVEGRLDPRADPAKVGDADARWMQPIDRL